MYVSLKLLYQWWHEYTSNFAQMPKKYYTLVPITEKCCIAIIFVSYFVNKCKKIIIHEHEKLMVYLFIFF